jgi:hypothetical protein
MSAQDFGYIRGYDLTHICVCILRCSTYRNAYGSGFVLEDGEISHSNIMLQCRTSCGERPLLESGALNGNGETSASFTFLAEYQHTRTCFSGSKIRDAVRSNHAHKLRAERLKLESMDVGRLELHQLYLFSSPK